MVSHTVVYMCLLVLTLAFPLSGAPRKVAFSQSADSVEAYDFVEVSVKVEGPDAANPFTDVKVSGSFEKSGGSSTKVEGFCDSADGSTFRIRFMPSSPGEYSYSIVYLQGSFESTHSGKFHASDGHRWGPIRVDPKYPWHFIWEGTGKHYFFHGTTAFFLMGWREERVINYSIERLVGMKINRIRVLVAGAARILWGEPVMTGDNFKMLLRPWVAKSPDSFDQPGNDYTRFNVAYWQKWERMLRFARDRNVVISAILDISTHKAQPAADSEDELRYIRYAVARLSAYSNLNWDPRTSLEKVDTFT